MKEQFKDLELTRNEDQKRFEMELGGYFAFINYGEMGSQIALVHTETDPELASTGAAAAVVEKTLQWIEDNNKTLLPFCPFVFEYIRTHPDWKCIVHLRFKGYDKL